MPRQLTSDGNGKLVINEPRDPIDPIILVKRRTELDKDILRLQELRSSVQSDIEECIALNILDSKYSER